jgi:hypothetical protein
MENPTRFVENELLDAEIIPHQTTHETSQKYLLYTAQMIYSRIANPPPILCSTSKSLTQARLIFVRG